MKSKEISQGLAETYIYQCKLCGMPNLSRDEVRKIGGTTNDYVCDRCVAEETMAGERFD